MQPQAGRIRRRRTRIGDASIDYADPDAVKALNQALLKSAYGIDDWDVPPGYLCPPIPGRSDYLHYLADLLASEGRQEKARRDPVTVLDIGTGANCIYPLIGASEYGWRFVASEIDPVALRLGEEAGRRQSRGGRPDRLPASASRRSSASTASSRRARRSTCRCAIRPSTPRRQRRPKGTGASVATWVGATRQRPG